MMDPGKRDQLIVFERAAVTIDDYGGETSAWATYASAWAQVRRGTGQERREASQEAGSQTATFVTDWNPTLDVIQVTDRIIHRGDSWDVTDVAADAHREIQFTATRSA